MTQHDVIRNALQQKLEQLQQIIGKIEHSLRETPEADSEEQALGRENDEVLERLDKSEREEIQMIEAALARMDAGTYGICVSCGGELFSSQRLAALPYTTACITCAR